MKKLLLTIVLLSITGCAYTPPPPPQYDYPSTLTSQHDYDYVWGQIVEFVTDHDMPMTQIDKASGLMMLSYTSREGDGNNWMDCGEYGNQIDMRRARIRILARNYTDSVTVSVRAWFYYIDEFSVREDTCSSTGLLERKLFEYIEKK